MNLRRREPEPPTPWVIKIQPDVVLEEEWQDEDGNTFLRGKRGWTFIAQRERPAAFDIGGADTYDECLVLAKEAMNR